jgi:uncharacterized protein (DUF697 family)
MFINPGFLATDFLLGFGLTVATHLLGLPLLPAAIIGYTTALGWITYSCFFKKSKHVPVPVPTTVKTQVTVPVQIQVK